ncbi:DUF2063 domain-containing protein [Rhodoferax lacus]|uniref:DUF2063 domain-containing protein n=1 Tax=Rhodoferax lacus TaxID=2184758 RepID=A0A3E1RG17_9BURK|nr:DNA-binding domain-containing protein [Rhodoferax lacus]RFO98203.1 DUF2063 domain-containing protein [Rhodoferax lacus]
MMQLQTLQSAFQDALLQDRPLEPALLDARGVLQFGVYRNAYRARLRAALRDNFEVLPLVMGDEAFDALANAYIEAHPSAHYSLRWFGHQLCSFMRANEALVDHPALVDLARMEWALRQAFDAGTAATLTAAELAAVPAADWADLCFALHPSVQLLELQWAIGPIWHALKSGQTELDPPAALNHHLLVWRQGMNTQWKSLNTAEVVFVQGLLAGQHFGQVCGALAQCVGEEGAAAAAVALLSELLHAGALGALPSQPTEISKY